MSDESTFHLVFILLFVPGISIAVYFRIKSEKDREKVSLEAEGMPLVIARTIIGIAMMLGVLAYMINPKWMSWSSMPLPAYLRWIGAGVVAATTPLFYWAVASLGKNLTKTVATRRDHTLVTSGPYRWIRHPLYATVFLGWVIGVPLLTANWFIGLTALLAFITIGIIRVRKEEAKLIERFGDKYREYMKRTGRYFPRLWGRSS